MTRHWMIPLLLAGCAASGAWPSLAPRPGETPRAVMGPAAPAPGKPVDAAVEARIAAQAQAAEGALLTARSALEETLPRARNAARGSDAWVAAQLALSRFEAAAAGVTEARGAAEAALGDVRVSAALSALLGRLTRLENDNVVLATNAAGTLTR